MALTVLQVQGLKPKDKPYRLADGGGLYVEVRPQGGLYWRLKYRFDGKENRLALGVFPDVTLAQARERRDAARKLLAQGLNPSTARKADRLRSRQSAAASFSALTNEWLHAQAHNLSESTQAKKRWMADELLFPWLGARPISEITAPELLSVLRRTEARGKLETVQRAKQLCGAVFRYAVATGRAERDPTADLRGALRTPVSRRRSAITDPRRVGEMLRHIAAYSGQPATCAALRLAPLVFVRPGELRAAEWSELTFDPDPSTAASTVQPVWRIPARRMKMGAEHLVPLSRQAVEVLRDIYPITGSGRYVFPSMRSTARPLSENTVNAALRSLGYDRDTMTGHGFRAMASTLLNEQGYSPDVIERQLAHVERNKVRAAYNRAEYLDQRRQMMQAWADYLDGLRAGANVVPIHASARRSA